jgi:hypothetical protein
MKKVKKPVKKVNVKKLTKVMTAKVPIEDADLDNMTKEQILATYAEEIEEHGDWIYREQDRGGPTYSRKQCIEQAKQEVIDGTWPISGDDHEAEMAAMRDDEAILMKMLGAEWSTNKTNENAVAKNAPSA